MDTFSTTYNEEQKAALAATKTKQSEAMQAVHGSGAEYPTKELAEKHAVNRVAELHEAKRRAAKNAEAKAKISEDTSRMAGYSSTRNAQSASM